MRSTCCRLLSLSLSTLLCMGALCDDETPAPVCPNTIAEEGENPLTCCRDAGCDFGACVGEPDTPGECLEAWQRQCITAGGPGTCGGAGLVCGASNEAVPSYDCTACPCGGADACYEGVCTDAATRELERFDDEIADDLDMTEYARLFDVLTDQLDAIPVEEAAVVVGQEIARDSRTTSLIAGADPAMDSTDLDTVVRALLLETPFTITRRVDARARAPDEVCAEVQSAVSTGVLPGTFVVAFVPDDHGARASCEFPGTFARCDVPLVVDCAAQAGRLTSSVIVVDQVVAMRELDQSLLIRAGLAPPETRDAFLQQALTEFDGARDVFPLQEGFRVGNRFAAAFVDAARRVTWLVLADPNARADFTTTYRLVWNDPPSQLYMIDHDIQSRDCAFDELDGGLLLMSCDNNGFTLSATVDPGIPAIIEVEQNP